MLCTVFEPDRQSAQGLVGGIGTNMEQVWRDTLIHHTAVARTTLIPAAQRALLLQCRLSAMHTRPSFELASECNVANKWRPI